MFLCKRGERSEGVSNVLDFVHIAGHRCGDRVYDDELHCVLSDHIFEVLNIEGELPLTFLRSVRGVRLSSDLQNPSTVCTGCHEPGNHSCAPVLFRAEDDGATGGSLKCD